VPDASVVIATAAEGTDALPPDTVSAEDHVVTSDLTRAFSTAATAFPRNQILRDRNEARFLASAEIDGKWFAVSKTLLTKILSQGQNAVITDVPDVVLTCPGLIAPRASSPAPNPRASSPDRI
jgi:hypothetical protein